MLNAYTVILRVFKYEQRVDGGEKEREEQALPFHGTPPWENRVWESYKRV